MTTILTTLRAAVRTTDRGAAVVEYTLLVALVSGGVIGGAGLLNAEVQSLYAGILLGLR